MMTTAIVTESSDDDDEGHLGKAEEGDEYGAGSV